MPPTDPGHSILGKNDDGRRFLFERFGEVNTTPVPKTGMALTHGIRDDDRSCSPSTPPVSSWSLRDDK
jgi:hypothetical protein